MMQTVEKQRVTGQSAPLWLYESLRQPETKSTGETVVFVLSGYPSLGNILDCLATDSWDCCTLNYYTGLTDPEARLRVQEPNIAVWSQNLSSLNMAAQRVIPGLRELTASEQHGLRQYRKRIFRKI